MALNRRFNVLTESEYLNPGLCNNKIRIMKLVKTQDPDNGELIATPSVRANLRAQIMTLTPRERDALDQRFGEGVYKLRFQRIEGISSEDYIEWFTSTGIRTLDVVPAMDPGGTRQFTVILAKERYAS